MKPLQGCYYQGAHRAFSSVKDAFLLIHSVSGCAWGALALRQMGRQDDVRQGCTMVHIPCAPRCNLNCAFCGGGLDNGEMQLPGRSRTIVSPENVVEYVQQRLSIHPGIAVLGIAGPGEPLYNAETLEVLEIIKKRFPEMLLCVGTNGFFLPERAQQLAERGVKTLTVTVNAVRPEIGAKLNPFLWSAEGNRLEGAAAAKELLERQEAGIAKAVQLGIAVKVNTVYVPGVNDCEIEPIAVLAKKAGASLLNIIPLKPAGRFCTLRTPSLKEVNSIRAKAGAILPQMYHCRQCRADACGLLEEVGTGAGCVK